MTTQEGHNSRGPQAELEVYSHAFCVLERRDRVIASEGESGKEVSLAGLRGRVSG